MSNGISSLLFTSPTSVGEVGRRPGEGASLTSPTLVGEVARSAGEGGSLTSPTFVGEVARSAGEGLRITVLCAALALAACAPKGDALYARAEQSLAKGEVRAAVIDLKNLVQSQPTNAKARALLGRALVSSGDFSAGAIELQKAKDLGAPKVLTLVPDCEILVAKGEFAKALADCSPNGAPAADAESLQMVRGRALLGVNRASEAKDQFRAVLAAKPDNLAALLGLANATYATGGPAAGLKVLDQASPAVKSQVRYWVARGGLYSDRGDLAGAEQAFAKAVELAGKGSDLSQKLMAFGGLAESQLRQSKLKEATATSDQLVKLAPDNPLVKLLRGQVAAASGNLDQARTLLEEAVEAMPQNYSARTLLGVVNAQQGNLGQAEMHFANVVANRPDDVRAQRLLAEVRARQQSPQAGGQAAKPALKQAGTGEAVVPDGGAIDYQREYLSMAGLLRSGDNDKAVAEAKALVQRSGNDTIVRNMAAGVLAAAGQGDASREQLAAALKLKPNDPATLVNLARLDLAAGKTADAEKNFRAAANDPESIEAQLALVQYYLGTRDFANARKVIDAAAKRHPDNAAISNARGLVLLGAKDMPGALGSFSKAMKQAPDAHVYALNLARAHLVNRDLNSALDVLNTVLKDEPKYVPALQLAAAASLQAGQLEKATGYVERLSQAAPDAQVTDMMEGDLALAQKRYGEGLEHYRKAAAKGTNSALVLAQYRAALLAGVPQPGKVLEDWVAANPKDLEPLSALAEDKHRRGDVDGAIKLYEKALAGAPDNVVLLNNLAVLYQEKGNPAAVEVAAKAYAAAPKAAAIQDTYGWALVQGGQAVKGVALLRDALKGMPDNAEVQYHYAAALVKTGNTAEALPLLKKAVNGQLPPGAKSDAQKLLKQISN